VGIKATGSMHWLPDLMEELEIDCRVGRPHKIRKADARKQKRDWDARSRLELLAEDCFPSIWMPSTRQWMGQTGSETRTFTDER